jgi:hypothetical protein
VIKLPDVKNNEINVPIPFEVYLEIKGTMAFYPDRAHLFEWGRGNFLFIGLDKDVDFVKNEGKKDVRYLQEKKRVRDKANLNNAQYWNLKRRPAATVGCQDPITKMWPVPEPQYEFYFDKQHHHHVLRKVPVASDLKTRKKYYCRKICDNCGRIFFSVRSDARFCNMRTCQKRKKNY